MLATCRRRDTSYKVVDNPSITSVLVEEMHSSGPNGTSPSRDFVLFWKFSRPSDSLVSGPANKHDNLCRILKMFGVHGPQI